MTNLKNRAIIFIQKDRLEYFDETQAKIFQLAFQPNTILDLEIVDTDQLNAQIKTFIQTNKLTSANILFVISNLIIFEKTFNLTSVASKAQEIQSFLENIPFEHVGYKLIDSLKTYKVLAINKEIYTSLQVAFETFGFKALGIIAISSLGENYSNSPNLNTDIVRNILSRFDALQKESFMQEELKQQTQPGSTSSGNGGLSENNTNQQTSKFNLNKYRLPAMISVFVVLGGVLSFLVYKQYTPKAKAYPLPTTVVVPTLVPPTPTLQPTSVSTPSATPKLK